MLRLAATAVLVLLLAAAGWWLLARPAPEVVGAPAGLITAPAAAPRRAPELAPGPDDAEADVAAGLQDPAPAPILAEAPGAELAPRGSLRGRVLDAAGPRASVRLELLEDLEGPWLRADERELARGASGDDGRFELTGIPADRATRLLLRDGLRRVVLEGLAVPADGALDLGDVLLSASAGLAGVVGDGQDEPLAGATVLLGDEDAVVDYIGHLLDASGLPADLPDLPQRLAQARVDTASDGRFAFDGLLPGPCVLHVSAPGRRAVVRFLELQPGRRELLAVDLPAGERLEGRVQAPDGRAIPGAVVSANSDTELTRDHPAWMAAVRAGPDGRFRLEGLPAGDIALDAFAPGFAAEDDLGPVATGSRDTVIVLRPLPALRATVLAPDGSPAASFNLDGLPLFEGLLGNLLERAQTWRRESHGPSARGRALLRTPHEERTLVLASGPGGLRATPFWYQPDPQGADVAHTFHLREPRELRGRVTAADGAPLAGAEVRVLLGEGPATDFDGPDFTDADGRFRVLAPRDVDVGVHVSAAGHVDQAQGVPEAADGDVRVVLQPAGSLRVLLGPDAAVRASEVELRRTGGERTQRIPRARHGCVFPRLAPGRYLVTVKPEGGQGEKLPARSATVEVVAGRQAVAQP